MNYHPTILSVAAMLGLTEIRPQVEDVQQIHDGSPVAKLVLAELGSTDCFCGAQVHVMTPNKNGEEYRMAWDLMIEVELPEEFEGQGIPALKFQICPQVASMLLESLEKAVHKASSKENALMEYANNLNDLEKNLGIQEAPEF